MGIPLTQEEKDQIQIIPTENLLALLAYCKGLDYVDREMFEQARNEFQNAIELDPNFSSAAQKIEQAQTYIEGETEITKLVQEIEQPIEKMELANPTIADRLQHTQQNIGAGFIPGVDSRDPVQEQSQQTFGNTASIEIEVPLPQ
ncbi:MAG: tetratricopeptide repeat protein [bacterium]